MRIAANCRALSIAPHHQTAPIRDRAGADIFGGLGYNRGPIDAAQASVGFRDIVSVV
jgi:hypothetical protein